MKRRLTEAQIVTMVREAESTEIPARDSCRKHGSFKQTYIAWKYRYGRMDVCDAAVQKELETDNAKLKRLLASSYWSKRVCGSRPKVTADPDVQRRALTVMTSWVYPNGPRPGRWASPST